jgi:hypothetical protein
MMAARCDFSDLPAGMCAHCTGAEARARAEERSEPGGTPGPWFTAGFGGTCATCGDPIVPGDTIRADGRGGYVCGYPCS